MLFTKKNGKEVNIPIPEPKKEETFKITIEKITKTHRPETTPVYSGPDGNFITDWSEYHNLPDEEQRKYKTIQVPTGNYNNQEHKEELYSQEKYDLDVAEIVMYINRSK